MLERHYFHLFTDAVRFILYFSVVEGGGVNIREAHTSHHFRFKGKDAKHRTEKKQNLRSRG